MIKTIKLSLLCSAMVISLSQPAFAIDLNDDSDNISGPEATNSSIDSSENKNYSISGGYTALATGVKSTALGHFTTASGKESTSVGRANEAFGVKSSAIGSYNNATGSNSNAIGTSNTTGTILVTKPSGVEVKTVIDEATAATAVGNSNDAVGDYSTALGSRNQAGDYQTDGAETPTVVKTNQATAVGFSNTATVKTPRLLVLKIITFQVLKQTQKIPKTKVFLKPVSSLVRILLLLVLAILPLAQILPLLVVRIVPLEIILPL